MARRDPSVTLIAAVFNEAASIDGCLDSLAAQSYRGPLSMVVADGGSNDGTRERLADWEHRLTLTVVDNPERRQSPGLNRAAAVATGDVLIRFDAHTVYAPDYVAASIRALEASGARAVGGPLRPIGISRFGRAVAAAMRSPIAVGPAKFHRETGDGDVDTVYLGAFSRTDFAALGGFRSLPSGAGEDADFYFRMRRRGWRVRLDPAIRSEYRPRETPKALFRQHLRYGRAKPEMLWANGEFPSWRPLAPALLVAALVAGLGLAMAGYWWPLVAVSGAWLGALTLAGLKTPPLLPLVIAATVLMHIGYGIGFWVALVRGPGPVRRALASSA